MKEIIIHTDGACRGNPGPGGYGAIMQYKQHKKEISGSFRHTTNNRMEMLAVVESLKSLKEFCSVKLYTDSKYICEAINKNWLANWKNKDWKSASKAPVKNSDLWKEIDTLLLKHKISFFWVKGHADNEMNNRADELAVDASKKPEDFQIDEFYEDECGLNFG
ncbi:MAG: ribonuclease HI [Lentisphaeraceae bacterium]|nr:ribonuclease HI [Lentisphaeraceae bacterium]